MSKHISKLQAPLTMDSTISEFRKKFREDKEFQQHCKCQRGRKDGKGSNYWSRNVDFAMAILLGGCYKDPDHPEGQQYCVDVHNNNVNSWRSSIASKMGRSLPPTTDKNFTKEANKFGDFLNGEITKLYDDIFEANLYGEITLQYLVDQVTNTGSQRKNSKDPKYTYRDLIQGDNDAAALKETLKELIAPSAMEKTADLISHGEARQIVFTGAPGTGKTYIAKELAKRFYDAGQAETLAIKNGEKQPYVQVQFHPSYDYTDFVEGLRPIELKSDDPNASKSVFFGKVDGQFKQFCRAVVEKNAEYARQKESDTKKTLAPALNAIFTAQNDFDEQADALYKAFFQAKTIEPDSVSLGVLLNQISKKQALAYQQELEDIIRSKDDGEADRVFVDSADEDSEDEGSEDECSEENDIPQTDEPENQDEKTSSNSNRQPNVAPNLDPQTIWKAFDALLTNIHTDDKEKDKIKESRDVLFASDRQVNNLSLKKIDSILNQINVGEGNWYFGHNRMPNNTSTNTELIKTFLNRQKMRIHPLFGKILLLAAHQEQAEKLYRTLCDGEEKEKAKKLSVHYRHALLKTITEVFVVLLQISLEDNSTPDDSTSEELDMCMRLLKWLKDNTPEELDMCMWVLKWLKDSIPDKASAYKMLGPLESDLSGWQELLKTLESDIVKLQNPKQQQEQNVEKPADGKTDLDKKEADILAKKDAISAKKDAVRAHLNKVVSLQEADFGTSKVDKCKLAPKQISLDPERIDYPLYFFIIDEINRANLSKVFGELMYCLEKGKRGKKNAIKTQYQNLDTYDISGVKLKDIPAEPKKPEGDKKTDVFEDNFYIPKNVVVIGTMNDIDRSVDSMDFALRRRFEWLEFKVTKETLMRAFEAPNFGKGINKYSAELAAAVMGLNEYLTQADGLRYGLTTQHYISHGYFADLPSYLLNGNKKSAETFLPPIKKHVWEYRVEPLLREYLRGYSSTEIDKFIRTAEDKWLSKA